MASAVDNCKSCKKVRKYEWKKWKKKKVRRIFKNIDKDWNKHYDRVWFTRDIYC